MSAPAKTVVVGPDEANENNRRLIVDGSQWAKVYGWDTSSVEARSAIIAGALLAEPAPPRWRDRINELLETANRYLGRARQAEYALAAQQRLLTVSDWMSMDLAPEQTPVLAQFRAWNRPEAELMEQVVWFFNGQWRAYPQTEGTAFADRWKPLYNAAHFTPVELAHMLALVKGGTGGTKPGGGFTAEGVLALKAKLAGMV